ncbi:TetR/AcrR family transcriptional regulator [Agrococcus baldri]|uniref:TetR/AcrR family transcriptional regulator n=1 Tax=Agrococcus baldri TaxID=153730 RepID=UPI00296F2AB0|nr:TetR family transcriptional regulator [Agrococcus baldri]
MTAAAEGRTRRRPARERLLAAAARRFYADGIAATGIDAVIAEAGVAKMSLYNNFASKDALVAEYLAVRHEEWLELYRRRAAGAAGARERVLAVFDAYLDHAALAYDRGFRGCGLLNAAAELPAGHDGRAAVRAHKEQVEAILLEHLDALGTGDAARLARHLSLLLEGGMMRAGLEGTPAVLEQARAIATELLDAA